VSRQMDLGDGHYKDEHELDTLCEIAVVGV